MALANEVLSKMTLLEKTSFVVLSTNSPLENTNHGVARLCIPALSLTDGPNGLANGLAGVTQFPAAIGVAASFDVAIARSVGVAIAQEARAKGITTVQGPELNLARVPTSGRIFETYGEDPYLSGLMGVANIQGIQSTGELADAKHFTAYTQETARARVNQVVGLRALAELYNVPFQMAVQRAHVASIMCSYGWLNGVNTCASPYIYQTLRSWGFQGFVRSDLRAVLSMPRAFRAGISLVKPGSPKGLARLVRTGLIPESDLNRAVRLVLTEMFRFQTVSHPARQAFLAPVATTAHALVALRAAESSIVLLKNAGSILPLSPKTRSIAIIGAAAGESPLTTGGGSARVLAPYVITPLEAIRHTMGPRVRITYEPGGPTRRDFHQLDDVSVIDGTPLKLITPVKSRGEPGKADIAIDQGDNVTSAIATANAPGKSEGWNTWSIDMRAKRTGTYVVSVRQVGDTWLYLNGHQILASKGLHAPTQYSVAIELWAGQHYKLAATWFAVRNHPTPELGIVDTTRQISAAVAAARRAQTAIIFVRDYTTEGADRPNLQIPGATNALISAVAQVNHHVIVVLDTGGAVLMPWLSKVSAVLEAWYPGQEDGAAIAAVLSGQVNPSGRLPLTFPASATANPMTTASQFPGVNSVVNFGTGLNVGYRWYQTHRVQPLYAFGYGLSYTSFSLNGLSVAKTSTGFVARVRVTNTGHRLGADIVQAYVHFPAATGEPPEQLRAFTKVLLAPGASRVVPLLLPTTGFQVYQSNGFSTVPGVYRIDVGQSSADLTLHRVVSLP